MAEATVLLVDAGNSRIKWARASGGRLAVAAAFAHAGATLEDLLERHWRDEERPAAVVVSNVAGSAVGTGLSSWVGSRWDLQPRFARVQCDVQGICSRYDPPERLGVDRWLALIAARATYPGPLCVIDCGSAITLDYLDGDGVHQGGLIAPGLGLMRRSLVAATAALAVAPGGESVGLATDTAGGIAAGTQQAALGLIDRALATIRETWKVEPLPILTGGDGAALATHLERPHRLIPDLVLRGLLQICGSIR